MNRVSLVLLILALIFSGCSRNSTSRSGSPGTSGTATPPPPPPPSGGTPPAGFTQLTPSDGAALISTVPSMTWNDCTNESSYLLEIDDESSFAAPLVHTSPSLTQNLTFYSLPPGMLAGSQTYHWRVTAINADGQTIATNAPFRFTTTTAGAPGPFNLVSPIQGAAAGSQTPTLTWSNAAAEATFTVEIDNENTFTAPLLHQVNLAADSTSHVVPVGVLTGNGPYYWRVIGVNGSGQTLASNAPFSFTTGAGTVTGWSRTFGGSADDSAFCVRPTSDGGSIVAGSTGSFGNSEQAWLLKLSSTGTIQWQMAYGDTGVEDFRSVVALSDGYIAAGASGTNAGTVDFYVVRTDLNGTPVWQRKYGGSGRDFSMSIAPAPNNEFVLTGPYSNGAYDAVVLRISGTDGSIVWSKRFNANPPNPGGNDLGYCVQATSDNGFIFAGSSDAFGALYDGWVMKLDSIGVPLWRKRLSSAGHDQLYSAQQTADGGYALCGYTGNDAWILRIDSVGAPVWQKTLNRSAIDYTESIEPLTDGFLVAAHEVVGQGWLIRLDLQGNSVWQRTYGGTGENRILHARGTSDGGFVCTGDTKSFGAIGRDVWSFKCASDGALSPTLGSPVSIAPVDVGIPVTDIQPAIDSTPPTTAVVSYAATPTNATVGQQAP